jgi:transcriptional regulator with XRE-family HTH domain
MHRLSDTIRGAVKASDQTRAEIASGAGIPESALSRFVSSERGISVENLDRLAAHLGLRLVKGRAVKATKAGKRSTKGAK